MIPPKAFKPIEKSVKVIQREEAERAEALRRKKKKKKNTKAKKLLIASKNERREAAKKLEPWQGRIG